MAKRKVSHRERSPLQLGQLLLLSRSVYGFFHRNFFPPIWPVSVLIISIQLTELERAWGMKPNTLNLDTRYNIIRCKQRKQTSPLFFVDRVSHQWVRICITYLKKLNGSLYPRNTLSKATMLLKMIQPNFLISTYVSALPHYYSTLGHVFSE